jgi:hypothetical protein
MEDYVGALIDTNAAISLDGSKQLVREARNLLLKARVLMKLNETSKAIQALADFSAYIETFLASATWDETGFGRLGNIGLEGFALRRDIEEALILVQKIDLPDGGGNDILYRLHNLYAKF